MKKVMLFLATLFAVLLVGCTNLASRGAEVSDEILTSAEWGICNAASVGSIRRRYGSDQKRAAAWRALCEDDDARLIGPHGRQ